MRDLTGNLPALPGVFPDYFAPVLRVASDSARKLAMARWGTPSPVFALKVTLRAKSRCTGSGACPLICGKRILRTVPRPRAIRLWGAPEPHSYKVKQQIIEVL
jgi:hypothetical protein